MNSGEQGTQSSSANTYPSNSKKPASLPQSISAGIVLPYPDTGGTLTLEIVLLTLIGIIEMFRLFFGYKGNLGERKQTLIWSVILALPILVSQLYLILWQTYVLRVEVVLCAILLFMVILEVLLSAASIWTFQRHETFIRSFKDKPSLNELEFKRMRRDSEVSLCIKYLLFFFNVFFWLVGCFICGVALWARVAYMQENSSISMFSGWDLDPAFIFLFVGVVMFLLGFCGCVGALRENICLLKFFSICLSIIFFIQLVTGVLGFVFRRKIQALVAAKLQGTIVNYRNNDNLQNLIDFSQMTFKCCGLVNYVDWQKNIYFNCSQSGQESCSVPYSCCKVSAQRETLIYTRGCIDGISQWFNEHLIIVAGIAVGVAVLQIIGIVFASTLISDIRRQLAKWDQPRGWHTPLFANDM